MRAFIWFRVLMVAVAVACGSGPQPPHPFVFDLEGDLEPEEELRLDSLFRAHEQRTGNEIALVTTQTFHGRKALDFAVAFGDSLGVGKKDRDNGLTIAFSKAEREVFLATGYGTERVLHDSICERIIDERMIPHFKEGRHFAGLWAGSLAVVEFLERPENRIH